MSFPFFSPDSMSVRYNLPQHILNKYQADKKRVCWKYKEEKYKEDNRYWTKLPT